MMLSPVTCPKRPEHHVYHKETEKFRSKCNRAQFKDTMDELNRCLGIQKMTINKCLSTAVSIIKLNKFSEYFLPCRLPGSPAATPHSFLPSEVFYDLGNYLGMVFDENGRILHITKRQTEHSLPFNLCNIGSPISQICLNSKAILHEVFTDNFSHFFMELKYSKKDKRPTLMFFRGKVLINQKTQSKMFLGFGYIEDKRDSNRDPFLFHTGCEIWVNSMYEVIRTHPWLEFLLEEYLQHMKGKPVNLMALLHPDDVSVIKDCTQQATECGFFKTSCRLYDGENYLYVAVQGHLQNHADVSKKYARLFVWPFACEDYKTGEMYLLDLKKLWMQKHCGKRGRYLTSTSTQNIPKIDCISTTVSPASVGKRTITTMSSESSSGRCTPKRPKPLRTSSSSSTLETTPLFGPTLDFSIAAINAPYTDHYNTVPSLTNSAFKKVSPGGTFKPVPRTLPIQQSESFEDIEVREELPNSSIKHLFQLHGVLTELKVSNPELYRKFSNVLSVADDTAGVLDLLPCLLRMQNYEAT